MTTTVDPGLQAEAERIVAEGTPDGHRLDAALAAVDPATSAVRSLVGGVDYSSSRSRG